MQAVVLVGGRGTRLGSLTADCPKPLLPVGGRPFLQWLLSDLDRYGFESILLLAGHRSEQFASFVRSCRLNARVDLAVEPKPQGTGGALLAACEVLADEFFLFNGDSLFDFNYLDMTARIPADCVGTIGLRTERSAARYGKVALEADRIVSFSEKGRGVPGIINGGVYYLRKRILGFVRPGSSLERDVFPVLPAGSLAGRVYDGFFVDIGVLEDYQRAQREVPTHFYRPAVFLDRDGTLNEDTGYVHSAAGFRWLPSATETLKLCNDVGYLVIVVTNQAGIARGYYAEDDVRKLHLWMNRELRPLGAHIDAFYFCPHHPTDGVGEYRCLCECRKPKPGLIVKAAAEWNIDLRRSLAVGDKPTDQEAFRLAQVGETHGSLSDLAARLRRVRGATGRDDGTDASVRRGRSRCVTR